MQTNLHRRYCYTADYYVIANKNVCIVFKSVKSGPSIYYSSLYLLFYLYFTCRAFKNSIKSPSFCHVVLLS